MFMIVTMLFSCNSIKQPEWKGKGFMKSTGTFTTDEGYQIKIEIVEKIVKYNVMDSSRRKLNVYSSGSISSIHRWYLFWENKILWIYSSDIGSSYWDLNKKEIIEKNIKQNKLDSILSFIPKEIKGDF